MKDDDSEKMVVSKFLNHDVKVEKEMVEELKKVEFPFWDVASDELKLLLYIEVMFEDLNISNNSLISQRMLREFLVEVFRHYNDNSYHNFQHCFCVTQMMFCLLTNFRDGWLNDLEKLCLMIATVAHDLDHPGLNNNYQKKAKTELSLRYPDSYLERHHFSVLCSILKKPQCNLFCKLDEEKRDYLMYLLEELILATDMSFHVSILNSFKKMIKSRNYSKNNKKHRELVMKLIIKACDISNEARPLEISIRWADCLLHEFFLQGDREKSEGLEVDYLMDRNIVQKCECQIGFLGSVSLPLFEELRKVFPIDHMLKYLNDTLKYYQDIKDVQIKNTKKLE